MSTAIRRVVLAITLAVVALPSLQVVHAQTKPYAQPGPPKPGAANSEQPWQPPPKPSEQQQWQEMKNQEHTGRSGFWTSPYPARHGAYRYRLLLLGIAIALTMGLVMWRLIRRASLERSTRN